MPVFQLPSDIHEFLDGGIPRGKSLIYYTQPGVEGEIFGMQTAYSALKNGGNCVFVASSGSPDIIRSRFRELGWDIDSPRNRFFFVDAYSPLIGALSREKYIVPDPEDIHEFSRTMTALLKEQPASMIVFGSLSTIMDLCGEKETLEAVRLWNRTAAMLGHVLVYNFTAWPYSGEILSMIKKDLFNAVVSIGDTVERVCIGISIPKSDWMNNIETPYFTVC